MCLKQYKQYQNTSVAYKTNNELLSSFKSVHTVIYAKKKKSVALDYVDFK